MKVQYLAVVFIIIMLPISLVYSEYISAQLETVSLQISYDTKLDNATYDAIKAFQMNTINYNSSDVATLADSKIRDVEASANAFFKSLGTAFNMVGYDRESLSNYVPALVYTLYDGFYIYSQFQNVLNETDVIDNATYEDGQEIAGLKSYISYSCRYKKGTIDVTITYSLDNYITVQGYDQHGNGINIAGYLLDDVTYNPSSNKATYRGTEIVPENSLTQYMLRQNDTYKYIKINGVRYYKSTKSNDTTGWFTISNNQVQTRTRTI